MVVFKTEHNEGFGGTITRVTNKIPHCVFMGDFWERLKEDFQAKLSACIGILKYKCVLKSWPESKAVKK